MNKGIKNLLKWIIGLVILTLLFYKINFMEVYKIIINMNLLFIPLILLVTFLQFIIGVTNLKVLLRPLKISIPFWRLFKYHYISWALGTIIPGRLGEFSIIYFLKKEKVSLDKGLVISVIDRLVTLFTLSLFAIIGFFIFLTITQALQYLFILLVIFFIIIFFLFSNIGRKIVEKFIFKKYSKMFIGFSASLRNYLRNNKKSLLINFVLTIIKWGIMSLLMYIIFLSFDKQLNFIYVFLITIVAMIISLIPLTINGIGIKESMAVYLYNKIDVASSVSLGAYIIIFVLMYLQSVITVLLMLDKLVDYKNIKEELKKEKSF